MNRNIARFTLFLLLGCLMGASGFAQNAQAPLTKQEILQRLKPVTGQRTEQSDVVGEIEQRGIAFAVDEKTLEEFRKAGARMFLLEAIRRADPHAPRPKEEPPAAEPQQPAIPPATPEDPNRPRLRSRQSDDAPPPPEPILSEEERRAAREAELKKLPLLEQARIHAGDYLDELPNFIVTQFVTRSVRKPEGKDWEEEDKLEVELSYHDKRGEQFKLVKRNGKPTTLSYQSLGGATSTGEFGSLLGAVFAEGSRTTFKEVKQETFRDHPTTVFTFLVKKGFSTYSISDKTSGRTVTAGYEGTVWIENATAKVLRIEVSANDIQRGFPITLSESAVEYDWVTIAADIKFLLPVTAEVLLGSDKDRFYSRNVIELRNYRMFDSDVKIVPE